MTAPVPVPEPAPAITDLRNKALNLSPDEIGVSPGPDHPHVWGILLETGFPEALATLLVLGDGTVSLYLGHGGGVVGGGEHADVWRTARALLDTAQRCHKALDPTMDFPLPNVGHVKFYLLTFSGVLTADVAEEELDEGRHRLSALFNAGHDVITQLRLVSRNDQ